MGDPLCTSKAYLVENTVFIVSLIDTQFYSIMSSIHLSNFLLISSSNMPKKHSDWRSECAILRHDDWILIVMSEISHCL